MDRLQIQKKGTFGLSKVLSVFCYGDVKLVLKYCEKAGCHSVDGRKDTRKAWSAVKTEKKLYSLADILDFHSVPFFVPFTLFSLLSSDNHFFLKEEEECCICLLFCIFSPSVFHCLSNLLVFSPFCLDP